MPTDSSPTSELVDSAAAGLARRAAPVPDGEPGRTPRPARLERRWRTVDGYRMHSRESVPTGHARGRTPIVLVHGLVVSSLYMIPTAELLAPDFPVFAVDLPGFGRSDPRAEPLDVPGLADALLRWLDAAGIPRAVLLGNSLGCQIVADLAVRYPERVERVVLVAPTVDPRARSFLRQALRLAIDVRREKPSLALVHLRDYWAAGVRRAARTIRYMLRDRIELKLPRIGVPVLVVRGDRDPVVPQRWAEEVQRLAPLAELRVIPGAAHAVNYDAPLELVRALRPHVEGPEEPRA
jgi:2-hydroxy-6-oxonona-2,4-dienedioate hydrolase